MATACAWSRSRRRRGAAALLQAAQQRGLNLAPFNLADADAAALGAQAAWSGDLAALVAVAARAQTALLLVASCVASASSGRRTGP